MQPLILISNDDGVQSDGIRILAGALGCVGRVVVVAPDREQSASSHSLTLHRPLRVHRLSPREYSVDGTPTDCILLAVHEILPRRPDLIVSGINRGANLGDDVHYSGTVSAAMEGALMGIPSVAVSLVVWGDDRCHFETAANFGQRLCRKVLGVRGKGFVLNVNVPNVPGKRVRGFEITKLGKRNYGEVIFEKTDPRGKKYYWIGGDERTFVNIPGSDTDAVQRRKISITPLQADLTYISLLDEMRSWRL